MTKRFPPCRVEVLPTGCNALDRLLDGGLERDAITLVFGEGGSGKTNLALQCARQVALQGKRTAYVDTEGVSAVRLRQVFGAHVAAVNARAAAGRSDVDVGIQAEVTTTESHSPNVAHTGRMDASDSEPTALFHTAAELAEEAAAETGDSTLTEAYAVVAQEDAEHEAGAKGEASRDGEDGSGAGTGDDADDQHIQSLMERVLFYQPYTIEEQERLVQNATRGKDLGLIVVDSINMHYRLAIDGDGDAEKEATRSLYKQLHHLTGFARKHHIPVLITGQVYGGEDTTQPFARRVMEHLVKGLVRFEKRPDGARKATVIKHRSIEEGRSVRFRIGAEGLEDA